MMKRQRAFTLIELLIVVALIAIVLLIAAPSFADFILVQRLKSMNAQLVTDMQYARSEAVSRNTFLRVAFKQDSATSCYTLYALTSAGTANTRCNCLTSPPCEASAVEVRTIRAPASDGVTVTQRDGYMDPVSGGLDTVFAFDNRTGGLVSVPTDFNPAPLQGVVIEASISGGRLLRTSINVAGRPTVCAVGAQLGASAC